MNYRSFILFTHERKRKHEKENTLCIRNPGFSPNLYLSFHQNFVSGTLTTRTLAFFLFLFWRPSSRLHEVEDVLGRLASDRWSYDGDNLTTGEARGGSSGPGRRCRRPRHARPQPIVMGPRVAAGTTMVERSEGKGTVPARSMW